MGRHGGRLVLLFLPFWVMGQEEMYPPETFYGGGVGFSQMFLFVDMGKLESLKYLGTVGDTAGLRLNTAQFTYPFVVNGGEGFSQITGRWRLGGYAGVGSSFISERPEFHLFFDKNGNKKWDAGTEQRVPYEGDFAPDVRAKVSVWISGATVEYVFPIFAGLEISAGTLIGLGRLNLSLSESSGSSRWEDQFSSMFGIVPGEDYAVTDWNHDGDTTNVDWELAQTSQFPSIHRGRGMSSLTGTFFNMQPYTAIKLQFLDRVGIRLSMGFNLGKVTKGTWILNDRNPMSDSPETKLNGAAVRAMIYFGL